MDMEVMRKSHVKSMRLRWDYKPVSIDADIEQLDNHILNQNFVPVVDGRNVFIGIITRKEIYVITNTNSDKECEKNNIH